MDTLEKQAVTLESNCSCTNEDKTSSEECFGCYEDSLDNLKYLKKEWTKTFFDNLDLGLKLHGITEVWCFDHLDCGMYKATFGLDKDLDPKIHIDCMEKLKKLIKKKHPELKFRSFLIDSQGHVSSV
jgi:hypothetical protein